MDDEIKGLIDEIKVAKSALEKQQTELKEANALALKAAADGATLAKDQKDNIDKALTKANETGELVKELAQKIDTLQKGVTSSARPLSMRGEIAKSLEEAKERHSNFVKGDAGSMRLVIKAITSAGAAGLLRDPYVDSLVGMERQPLRIRSLLNVIPVQSDSVKYGRQSTRTNAARIVAEGTTKPYSNYAWTTETATIETIAHLTKLTLQAIADAPRLVGEVESEMRFGLAMVEEAELLNGDGTAGHLSGLIDNSTAYALPAGANAANVLTPVDQLRMAILKIHLTYAAPDGHILNPIDVANIELLRRDPDKGGGYLFGNPDSGDSVLRLWRMPVVESPSMAVGKFLTGAFKYAANLYAREGVNVLISTENDDDFETNQATMRCEERVGLAVRRPYALVYGTLIGS